jgi:formylglycine-generating enzyme required for sulfatase activity
MALGDLENRTRCWVAHASHAQSYGLRQDLFRDIDLGHRDMNNRGLRGGAFNNNDNNLQSSNRGNLNPTSEASSLGFRVSSLRKAAPA